MKKQIRIRLDFFRFRLRIFCKEYLALQNSEKKILFAPGNYHSNKGNYALKIDGGRQTDSLIEKLRS